MNSEGAVLVVEDDSGIRQSLLTTLTAVGFQVGESRDGEESLVKLRLTAFEVVLLDINMPGIGGVEACRQIRRLYPRLPIIMLTVHDTEEDKIRALDAGADDYITKPFQVGELAARLRSSVRRYRQPEVERRSEIQIRDIKIDPVKHVVLKAGRHIHLTPKEFELLHVLMKRAGRPVPHARLLTELWGTQFTYSREYLRVLVNQLRKKIEDDPANPTNILTESSVGYCFRDDDN